MSTAATPGAKASVTTKRGKHIRYVRVLSVAGDTARVVSWYEGYDTDGIEWDVPLARLKES